MLELLWVRAINIEKYDNDDRFHKHRLCLSLGLRCNDDNDDSYHLPFFGRALGNQESSFAVET